MTALPSEAALVKNVLVVSKLICRKGEEQSTIPIRFMGKYEPVRVMKSAMSDKWRGLTSIPYTPNTPVREKRDKRDEMTCKKSTGR